MALCTQGHCRLCGRLRDAHTHGQHTPHTKSKKAVKSSSGTSCSIATREAAVAPCCCQVLTLCIKGRAVCCTAHAQAAQTHITGKCAAKASKRRKQYVIGACTPTWAPTGSSWVLLAACRRSSGKLLAATPHAALRCAAPHSVHCHPVLARAAGEGLAGAVAGVAVGCQ
jgi:hypothetical protein